MRFKKYLQYLGISYVVAILFEANANFFFDGKLFQQPLWPIIFIVWYGLLYSIVFLIFRKRSIWEPVIAGAILGTMAEYFLFKRINIVVDPIIYAIMFFIPFKIYNKFLK